MAASSWATMTTEIDTHLYNLRECEHNEFIDDLVPTLNRLSFMLSSGYDPHAVGVYMIQKGLDEICLKMLTVLSKCLKDSDPESQSYLNLQQLLRLTLNTIDNCREFGDALVARGCVSVLSEMAGICSEERVDDIIHMLLFKVMALEVDTHLCSLKEGHALVDDLGPSLSRLSSMVLNYSDQGAFGVYMIEEGLDEICLKMLTDLSTHLKDNELDSQSYLNLHHLLVLTLNVADGCREFGEALVVRGCISVLLRITEIHTVEERVKGTIQTFLFNFMKLEIDTHLHNLKKSNACSADLVRPLLKLSSMVLDCSDPRDIVVFMIERDFDEMCQKMLTELLKGLEDNNPNSQSYRNLRALLSLTLNATNKCQQFGDALVVRGCVSVLLTMTGICTEEHVNNLILGVLHNCIRMSTNNRVVFRDAKAIAILQPLLESDSTMIQTFALMILAYIVNDKEREMLATSQHGLMQLILVLNMAVEDDSHTAVMQGTSMCFSVSETLDAINQLAINDTTKSEIEKQGAIPAIICMLQNDFSDDEHRVAVEALWNLSFVESIRDSEIFQSIIPALKKLAKSNNKDLQRVSTSTLWQIKGSQSEDARSSSTTRRRRPLPRLPSYAEAIAEPPGSSKLTSAKVMLSYQWDYQKRVLKIREKLENVGYRVWMDVSNIEGDILGAMADAVEESDVIIICMSERYRDSKSCRSEATYAYKLEKKIIPLLLEPEYKPDGWLGILQGMDLYYACHTDEELDRSMPALLKVINESTPARVINEVDGPITPTKQPGTQSSSPGPASPPAAAKWSAKEVQDWLDEKRLKCPELEDFEGCDLQELYTSLIKDVDKFKADLKSDYGMNGPTSIRFTAGLRQLFHQ